MCLRSLMGPSVTLRKYWWIDALTHWFCLAPGLAKILFIRRTLYANVQFMSFITTGKLHSSYFWSGLLTGSPGRYP